ncbi:hypothetical protein [Schaalia cardiffensis]|uniref:hypothetical protein n=1 Tax=Schaalia cardiffensis TaxID=181487 RepID=UPI0023F0E056|nr:hypothetical protein [Schaalia cardiffensis]
MTSPTSVPQGDVPGARMGNSRLFASNQSRIFSRMLASCVCEGGVGLVVDVGTGTA